MVIYVRDQQRDLHRQLAGAIKRLRNEGSFAAGWSLVLLSFLYGVFHAAGPGHGKAVISTYLLTHESAVRRGVAIAVAAALVQGITAIALVQVLMTLVGWSRRETHAAVGTLETVSFALIAVIGIGLTIRALWSIRRYFVRQDTTEEAGREPNDAGEACGSCGHVHMPSPQQLQDRFTWRAAIAMALSIGLRPCSGAVLVLLFAAVLSLQAIGILAVFAMSLGTAITVSALALFAVNFRRLASGLAGNHGGGMAIAGHGVSLLGGLVIASLGLSLLAGSIGDPHPLL